MHLPPWFLLSGKIIPKILLLYKVINTDPNVSRNCKHGSLVDSDGLERGGD